MHRFYSAIFLSIILISTLPGRGFAEPSLLQRHWMIGLVDALGLAYGLPDEPSDGDYLAILSGDRHLRIEAEQHLQPTDPVSVQNFLSFGPFSGQGWLSGVAEATTVHLRFTLPRSGHYQLAAVVRRSGFIFDVDGHRLPADGEMNFTRIELGAVALDAGEQEIKVHFPANGALDYLELIASPLPPIGPLHGWQPELPLTTDIMATTIAQVLAIYDLLPRTGEAIALEAEEVVNAAATGITEIAHLGQPSGGAWVRAGNAQTAIDLFFNSPETAIFDIELRGATDHAMQAALNGRALASITFPPYLATEQLGTFLLTEQQHRLTLDLPPRSGVDVLYLHKRGSRPEDFLRLAGLQQTSWSPQAILIDQLLALLAVLAPPR